MSNLYIVGYNHEKGYSEKIYDHKPTKEDILSLMKISTHVGLTRKVTRTDFANSNFILEY